MKNIIFSIIVIVGCYSISNAQNNRDYNWLFGRTYQQFGGNLIDFNNGGRIDTLHLGIPFEDNNAIISDKDGNLLFYANGCQVADATHEIMENGDSINYGDTWDDFCPWGGYPGYQNSIILPDPGNEDGYYLIHKRMELLTEPYIHISAPALYYTYIDIRGNNGRGTVVEKNKTIFRSTNLVNSYLSACKNDNGKNWWIIEQKKDTNVYFKILLSEEAIGIIDSQSIGPNLDAESGYGQAVFSPDGSKYVIFNKIDGALIYDFNRETGYLSNFRQVVVQDSGRFVGVAISPNSRYAYLSSKFDLYQIDLWAEDIQSTLTFIEHIDGFTDPTFLSTFNQAQLAPDCKIYIVSSATNNYLHVINKPDEKGKACDFRQHSIYLPKRNYNNSIPNFPHFRMDEEEVCDPTITSIFGQAVWYRRDLKVYPNPSSGVFHVELPMDHAGKIVVNDLLGNTHDIMVTDAGTFSIITDLSYLPSGSYIIEFYPNFKPGNLNQQQVLYSQQIVIER